MTLGPIVGGIGLLMMLRIDSGGDYLADVLPAVLVFGLGLSATVAPLTATVLDSVPEHRVGIASGINNGVSRVAGLLAIAILGAVISARFVAVAGADVAGGPLTANAPDASTSAFHLGVVIAGVLMILGGIASGLGIENPKRSTAAVPAGGNAAAGECGHSSDCDSGTPERSGDEAPQAEPA
jgi:hypothetical protein